MFLGIDLGTGSVKVVLMAEDGQVVAEAGRPYAVVAPQPGRAETDPEHWWRETVAAVREATAGQADAVRGIGLSGQAHGLVPCDAAGTPLRPAILWPDGRTVAEIADFEALPEALRLPLGNPIATGMAGLSLLWLKRHEPDLFARIRLALAPKDWLRLRMTGEVATEPTDASMTMLYDLIEDRWADAVIAAVGLDRAVLPEIVGSAEVAGRLRPEAADAFGLRPGLPVAAGLADTAACLLGLGRLGPGDAVLQIGSGMQLMAVTDRVTPEIRPPYNTYRGLGASLYKMAAMLNGGTGFEWARGVLGASWQEMYATAFAPGTSASGVMYLPYAAGERTPLLDPNARAAWIGLALGCGREHMIRAVFEGTALSVRDGWDALRATGVNAEFMLLTGGGSSDPRWQQMLADVLEIPLRPVLDAGNAPIGAAYLGGLVAEHWSAPAELPFATSDAAMVEPRPFPELDVLLARFRAAYRGLKSDLEHIR